MIKRIFSLKNLIKHLTPVNITVGLLGLIVVGLIKYYGIALYLLDLLNLSHTCFNEYIIAGFFGLTARLGLKGIVEESYSTIFMTMGPNELGNTISNTKTIGNNSDTSHTNNTTANNGGTSNTEGSRPDILPSNFGNPVLEWLLNARKFDYDAYIAYSNWLMYNGELDERRNLQGLFSNIGRLEFENHHLQLEINRLLPLSSEQHSVELNIVRRKLSYNKDIIYHLKYDPNNVNLSFLQTYLNRRNN